MKCEKCVKTFGEDNSNPAEWVMVRDSILSPGTQRRVYVCDEHSTEMWLDGWDMRLIGDESAKHAEGSTQYYASGSVRLPPAS